MPKKEKSEVSFSRHLPIYCTAKESKMHPSKVAFYTGSENDYCQREYMNDGIQNVGKTHSTSPKVMAPVQSHSSNSPYRGEGRGKKEFKYHETGDQHYQPAASNIDFPPAEISRANFSDESVERFTKSSKQQRYCRDNRDVQEIEFSDKSFRCDSRYPHSPHEYHSSSRSLHDSDTFSHMNTGQGDFELSKMHGGNKRKNYGDGNYNPRKNYQNYQCEQPQSQVLEMKHLNDFSESSRKSHVEFGYKSEQSSINQRHSRNVYHGVHDSIIPRGYSEPQNRFQGGGDSSGFSHLGMEVKTKMVCDRRNKPIAELDEGSLEELSSDEGFQSLSEMVHRKYSKGKSITMKDAKKIAVGLKLHRINQIDSENVNHGIYNSKIVKHEQSQKRIRWAKQSLNDKNYSSSFKGGSSINRKNIFLASAVPAKGKGAWKVKKEKAKGEIKESLKEFFNKLQVWSSSLKFIEGHFGTSVVSFFVFLRWLLFLNLYIFIIFLVFIVLPQVYFPVLQQRKNITTARTENLFDSIVNQTSTSEKTSAKSMLRVSTKSYRNSDVSKNQDNLELENLGSILKSHVVPDFLYATLYYDRTNYTGDERHIISEFCYKEYVHTVNRSTKYDVPSVIQDFFQGTGWMELTLMFTGYYLPMDLLVYGTGLYYNLSVAFLGVLLVLYIICLVMMINYASKGVRETLLSTESGVQSYCNMVFCGWDYCIESSRTAALKHKSILLELKSTLAEAKRQEDIALWTMLHKAKVYFIRFIVNVFVITSLVGTYYLIYYVAKVQLKEQVRGKQHEGFSELLIQFLPSITITAINFIMPLIFDILVRYESYGIQAALNMTLVRIIFVRLASIIILVITFYQQIACEPRDLCGIGRQEQGCPSPICWETHVGQQMYRLVLMDFFVIIAATFLWEVPRNFVVRSWKCKLTDMIGRQTFDVPSQVLAIVYGQTLCWLGVFYSPLLPAVCVIKLIILFYLKKFTLIVNCVPSQISYRASRSNAVFVIVLMLNFFITVAILGYSISSMAPSPGCSPFRHLNFMIDAIREALNTWSPNFTIVLKYIFSTGFAIVAIIVLCLAIYYYLMVTAAHKRMIKVLKSQLVLEGKDKQFLLSRLTEVACQGMAKAN